MKDVADLRRRLEALKPELATAYKVTEIGISAPMRVASRLVEVYEGLRDCSVSRPSWFVSIPVFLWGLERFDAVSLRLLRGLNV